MPDIRVQPICQMFVNNIYHRYNPQSVTAFVLTSCLFKGWKFVEKE